MIRLPDLVPGQTYRESEIRTYIALHGVQREGIRSDDYTAAISAFPHKSRKRLIQDARMWQEGHGREIVIEYALFDIERFASWFDLARSNLAAGGAAHQAAQLAKVEAIKERLDRGEYAFPVWIEKHLVGADPMAVWEGNHRLLAFTDLGMKQVPVFLLKYADSAVGS
jgi:hypothetical protein